MKGIRALYTMNPVLSADWTTVFPNVSTKDVAVLTASVDVGSPLISSKSFIVGTGLKKCNPKTLSGRFVAEAILLLLIDEVFEARIVFLGQTLSRVANTCSLIPGSSKTASTTRSALLQAFAKSTLPFTLSWI